MKKINQVDILGSLVILLLTFSFFACQKSSERDLTEKEVPQAVLDNFAKTYPDATVSEYAEEMDNGKKYFEISFTWQEKKMDVLFDENGNIANKEITIAKEGLPTAVKEQLEKNYSQYQIDTIERLEKEGKIFYEIKISNDEAKYELVYTDNGKLDKKEQVMTSEKD